jgi:hypothetical protein
MKNYIHFFLACFCIANSASAQFQYISPLPASKYHNPGCNIILRPGGTIDAASMDNHSLFHVSGSLSGTHEISIKLSKDQQTIIVDPLTDFSEGEAVNVEIESGIKKKNGDVLEGLSFSFDTYPRRTAAEKSRIELCRERIFEAEFGERTPRPTTYRDGDFPSLSIDTNLSPANGAVFYYKFNFAGVDNMFLCIMSSEADSLFAEKTVHKGSSFDINHNGYITVYNFDSTWFEVWDSSYNTIGIYRAGNGYHTDAHDFQIFPDGHSFVLSVDVQVVDMRVYDPSYDSAATVTGSILQELDSDKQVIFEWRSWDHVDITEAQHQYLPGYVIDYIHSNAIEIDTDGNILLSCRHLDQVLKIDRQTGETMWRLGGQKNEFTFTNDTEQFNYQHDIRRLANGHITLFDNGDYHSPAVSTAKEYELDEVNKTATLTWSYKHPAVNGSPVVSWAMGNMQRLPNGNTFINWGFIPPGSGFPNMTEVDSTGTILWEMHFTDETDDMAYRAHRYEWNPCARPGSVLLQVMVLSNTSVLLEWSGATGATSYLIEYRVTGSLQWDTTYAHGSSTSLQLKNLLPYTSYEWRIQSLCNQSVSNSAHSGIGFFTTLPTLLDSIQNAEEFIVYPNPANELIHIYYSDGGAEKISVTMLDMVGRHVAEQVFENKNGDHDFLLPIDQLSGGIYFLTLTAGEKKLTKKIMVE